MRKNDFFKKIKIKKKMNTSFLYSIPFLYISISAYYYIYKYIKLDFYRKLVLSTNYKSSILSNTEKTFTYEVNIAHPINFDIFPPIIKKILTNEKFLANEIPFSCRSIIFHNQQCEKLVVLNLIHNTHTDIDICINLDNF